jgi:hypothetical protein
MKPLFLLLQLTLVSAAKKPFNGSFEVVGTLCYPPDVKGEDKVKITTVSPASPHQRV